MVGRYGLGLLRGKGQHKSIQRCSEWSRSSYDDTFLLVSSRMTVIISIGYEGHIFDKFENDVNRILETVTRIALKT